MQERSMSGRAKWALQRQRAGAAFTLTEFVLCLFIVAILAAILFPLLVRPQDHNYRRGVSNLKQVALALLSYSQDYDDRFPPGRGYAFPIGPGGKEDRTNGQVPIGWGPMRTLPDGRTVPGLLTPYTKDDGIFRGTPVVHRGLLQEHYGYPSKHLGFMYNDLAAAQRMADFSSISQTVLVMDGEDMAENVGHAWLPDSGPYPTVFNKKGLCDPGKGATVRGAPRRLSDGANYALSDGRVRWFKGAVSMPPVYFPPRVSADPVALASEPKPGGDMKGYAATFRVR